eukprot:1147091-Pelagomonas_calceolata.AAC.5
MLLGCLSEGCHAAAAQAATGCTDVFLGVAMLLGCLSESCHAAATQAATGCTVVCGTRYRKGGGVAGWGFSRKLTSRGANQLASTLLGEYRYRVTKAKGLQSKRLPASLLGEYSMAACKVHNHTSIQPIPCEYM